MKTPAKIFAAAACVAAIICIPAFAACSSSPYVTSISKTGTNGFSDTYTVYYSDGSSSTFSVNNSSESLTADMLYEEYKEKTGDDITFEQFLEKFLTVNGDDTAVATNRCLLSTMKIYSQFVETVNIGGHFNPIYITDYNFYTGAAVIYDMDETDEGYSYIVTNYHVVYDISANTALNGGSNLAMNIYGYLYGSEDNPSPVVAEDGNSYETDENGYTKYDGGAYAIELEYVGGSVDNDIAVLRASTADIKAINPDACEVTIGEECHVGETAVAIGNPEDGGMSVTRGVISTVDEYINLNVDGKVRSYRSMRIDTPLYSGNSGGGLFNTDGELIGITNAGAGSEENINYAVPLDTVTGVANNIIYYYCDGDDNTVDGYDVDFGLDFTATGAHYVLDNSTGYGKVVEKINVSGVKGGSIAETIGINNGDIVNSIVVNGAEYELYRQYDISDISLTLRPGDTVTFKVTRGSSETTLSDYVLSFSDFKAIDD